MLAALEPLARDANDLPGVKLTGLVIGAILLWIALRTMFGKKDRKNRKK
jgi:hypothetical protein